MVQLGLQRVIVRRSIVELCNHLPQVREQTRRTANVHCVVVVAGSQMIALIAHIGYRERRPNPYLLLKLR